MDRFDYITGYAPGVIGRIVELHALYYSEHWCFGKYFEVKVAKELSKFISNYDKSKDQIYSLSVDGKIEGSISIDRSSENGNMAHLRWFMVSNKMRGSGAGNHLMKQAMMFCEGKKYDGVYLWTFQGLEPARHLYEKHGFSLTEERTGEQWGSIVTEQRFDAKLPLS